MSYSIFTINQGSVSIADSWVLDNISFNIHAGEVVAPLGESDAGKQRSIAQAPFRKAPACQTPILLQSSNAWLVATTLMRLFT